MKILHVSPYCHPAYAYGGPPKAVYEIAVRQAKAGHQVTVLTTTAYLQDQILKHGSTTINGIRIVRLKNLSNFLMWRYHFSTPLGAFSFFKNHTFDVIHLHEVRTLLNLIALLRCPSSTKVVISPWGTLPHNQSLVVYKAILDSIMMPLLRKKITVGIAQTAHEVSTMHRLNIGKSIKLLPLSINIAEFKHLPGKKQSRKEFGIKHDSFVYLFLGRFSPKKGLDVIVKSFDKVAAKIPNAYLLLVGRDDNYMPRLRSMISTLDYNDRIIISAPLYGKNRLKAYSAADAFVFSPSVFEETGTACLEALACGVPVITTKQAKIPLMKAEDGVIHAGRSEKEIAKHMLSLFSKKCRVNSQKIWKYFNWDHTSQMMLTLYNQI